MFTLNNLKLDFWQMTNADISLVLTCDITYDELNRSM